MYRLQVELILVVLKYALDLKQHNETLIAKIDAKEISRVLEAILSLIYDEGSSQDVSCFAEFGLAIYSSQKMLKNDPFIVSLLQTLIKYARVWPEQFNHLPHFLLPYLLLKPKNLPAEKAVF